MNKKNKKKCENVKISESDRAMMSLRLQGKTYNEIASIVHVKPDAVRQRFSAKLNEQLDDFAATCTQINWEHCQKKIISLGFDIYKEAEEHSDKRQTLNTLSKLLEPFTPKDKQSNVADIHIRILTAKEAEKAKAEGEEIVAVDDYFNEGKDEEQ